MINNKLTNFLENISKKKKYINLLKVQTENLNQIKNQKIKVIDVNDGFNIDSENQLIKYVIDIKFSQTNTLLHVMSFSGKLKFFISAGQLKYKGKNKKARRLIIKDFYKMLITKLKFLKNQPVAINLNNVDSSRVWVIKLLKKKFFIKVIKIFQSTPHNGCRKKKIRRKKFRTKSKKRRNG